MKEYRFSTQKGAEVMIETELSDTHYFGLYITCESVGVAHKWCPPSQLSEGNTLKFRSEKLDQKCAVMIPTHIYTDILKNYQDACRNTGKIIVAVLHKGETTITKLGIAIAEVHFKGYVTYRMPDDMETVIRCHSCDDKIYAYADERVEVRPFGVVGNKEHYFFTSFKPHDPFFFERDGTEQEGEHVECELVLEVVTPYQGL